MNAYENETKLYKEFLFTKMGNEMIRQAIAIKKEWNNSKSDSDITINTSYVKPKFICSEIRDKLVKIKITPIGLNNHCHYNVDIFKSCGYTSQLGFNLCACPCGKKMSYELHSVNKKDGVYYDFTRDFNDETEKYFLPIDTNSSALTYIEEYGNKYININKGCKCKITWNNAGVECVKEAEFVDYLYYISRSI